MEKRKVQLVLRSTQHDISEKPIEQIYDGFYSFRNNTHFISYEEIYDSEAGSAAGGTSLIKIKPDSLYLLKKGAITTRMEFDTSNNHFTSYQTPYGTFQLEIITDELNMQQSGEDISLKINYRLNMDGKPLSRYLMEISVHFITKEL